MGSRDKKKLELSLTVINVSNMADGSSTRSNVIETDGLQWYLCAVKSNSGLAITLQCYCPAEFPHWTCETLVTATLIHSSGSNYEYTKVCTFRQVAGQQLLFGLRPDQLAQQTPLTTYNGYANFDRVQAKVKIVVERTSGVGYPQMPDFAAPSSLTDVALIIEGQQLHVSKQFLSINSPVFEAMFFKNFEENGKNEVVLGDLVYLEFLDVLRVLYPPHMHITQSSVLHILVLADRYELKAVSARAEEYLINATMFNIAHKLMLADAYRLTLLRDNCLAVCGLTSICELKKSKEFEEYSDALKAAILDRMINLTSSMQLVNPSAVPNKIQ